eukprot:7382399-Prymnesium_polylepis.1
MACSKIFQEFGDSIKTMLANPIGVAVKQLEIIEPSGPASTEWRNVGDELAKIVAEQALEAGHLSKKQKLGVDSLADAVWNLPDELCNDPIGQIVVRYFGWKEKIDTPVKIKTERTDEWYQTDLLKTSAMKKAGVQDNWGSAAFNAGVCLSKDCKTIWFGSKKVDLTGNATLPTTSYCLAKWHGGFDMDWKRN